MNSDDIGDRFKGYERCFDFTLPRRLPMVVRVDGRAFHSLDLKKPFDVGFSNQMIAVASHLVNEIQGAVFAITHSDEVSVVARDDMNPQTQPWVGKRLGKVLSLSASMATRLFIRGGWIGEFDARAFVLPDLTEVINYCIWRQQDATRNSISMLARAHFSHATCMGKNSKKLVEMLFEDQGVNWADTPTHLKRCAVVTRMGWDLEAPIFTEDRSYLEKLYRAVEEVAA